MSIVMQINPFEFFTDTNGDALDSGYIWIGQINLDPRQYPVEVYYDAALTIPAPMPLRTSGGYVVRNGSPTFLYISGNYSILVQDRKQRQIYYVPDFLMIGNGQAVNLGDLSNTTDPSLGVAIAGRAVVAVESIAALLLCPRRTDLRYSVKGYNAGTDYGGGPGFYWDSSSVETENLVTIFAVPGVPTGRFKRGGTTGSILVDDAGAQPGVLTSQRLFIERADAVALATGASLCFRGGVTYYADELFLKSTVILGNNTKLVKTATTTQGFLNWGNKPTGIVDGFLSGFYIDANGKDNVVNLRMYGNHTRPKVRNLELIDSDQYAFGIGSLTSQGDKLDVINGLDIDGIYIASERGNISLATQYSFGLEFFPGVNCTDWRIRNVTTIGKIINKVHSVQGLDIDGIDFRLSAPADPQSSAFCEINNCADVVIGSNCMFDTGNNASYFALKIGGSRVPGGLAVTRFIMGGQVNGRMAIETVENLQMVSSFRCYGLISMFNTNGRIGFNACRVLNMRTDPSATSGAIAKLDINGVVFEGSLRLEQTNIPVTELIVTGGEFNLSTDQIRLDTVDYALFNGTSILLRGSTPQAYAFSAKNTAVTLHNVYFDGFTTWNRPIFAVDATGQIRMVKCVLDRFVSSTILASGSAALTLSIGNIVNGVAVP